MPTTRTDQEMFDHVLQAIRKQGKPSIAGIQCKYVVDDSCRCSAGHLMDSPSADMEGTVNNPRVWQHLLDSGVMPRQHALAKSLQESHDRAADSIDYSESFMSKFEMHMSEAAKRFGLKYDK